MLVFRNKNLIPKAAITTLGVNVKLNDNPIGQFGTGLKYAIAIILRLGGKVTIYRGNEKLEFTLKTQQIRGKDFKIVCMNGRQLGFTDQLGLNWEPWMAYRELASNVRDEGGTVRLYEEGDLGGTKGETTIFVSCKEVEKTYLERGTLFLSTEPLYALPGVEVHASESEFMFYRGIRVMKLNKKSKYTYNLTQQVHLTEDRTILYPHMVPLWVARAIVQSPNRGFLTSVLDGDEVKERWEQTLPYNSDFVKEIKPTDQFMDLCEHLKAEKRLLTTASGYYGGWADKDPNRKSPFDVHLSEQQELMVRHALDMVRLAGIDMKRDALVFKSKTNLGKVQLAGRTTLIVSADLLNGSEGKLALALVEGAALLHGGGMSEQLAYYILHRSWIPSELTEGFDPRAAEEEVIF